MNPSLKILLTIGNHIIISYSINQFGLFVNIPKRYIIE